MLFPRQSTRFKRYVKRVKKRGKHIRKQENIVVQLAEEELLPARNRDHDLTGNWIRHRECHIEADWLLIYKIEGNELLLVRTGSHADLFD